jgi:poly-beta-1,6-N-acetyl-D-glucosamine synthase
MISAELMALAIFVLALLQLAYTFVGYPVLLLVWSRLLPRPTTKSDTTPSVAIVVVVHNGSALIDAKIHTCLAQQYPTDRLRVVIASDGSTDDTNDLVRAAQRSDSRITLLAFPERRGKAACLNDAAAICQEEIIVFTDARQRLNPTAVKSLVSNLASDEVGAVSGQLLFETHDASNFGKGLDAYWRYEKFMRKAEARIASSVGVSGALYAIHRELFQPIPPDTVLDDLLIPMNIVLVGKRVLFEDDAIAFDRPSQSPAQERTRKVRTLAGNFQLIARMPRLLVPGLNPIAFQFWSHKVMRLLAPLALAGALAANVYLAMVGMSAPVVFAVLLAGQLLCYAAAFIGLASPGTNRFLPVKFASAFVSLNGFVVLGFIEFCANRDAHLWKNNQVISKHAGS